uniref:Uncharacterized protein n=1 Tax=Opuntia streptacantha TaxID=393608 RepID=A0A7C9AA31_OPUST
MGIIAAGLSKRLYCAATVFLFTSTIDATIVARMLIRYPMPILCKHVMPDGFPVNLRTKGTKNHSYKASPVSIVTMVNIDRLAGGISNDGDRCRSMLRAC